MQPVADDASNETVFANGVSAVKTGDIAVAEKMEERLRAKAGSGAATATARAHADHGAAAVPAAGGDDSGSAVRVMHRELAGLIALSQGQKDRAVALLAEAAQIEERMRPPNGAADPIKPAHEALGEAL